MRAGEGWAARRCLARVWVSRLRDSSPLCGLMSPDQYNNCAALHCDTLHQHHSSGSVLSSVLLNYQDICTSHYVSTHLGRTVGGCGWAGLGWAGRALAGIFIELIRECWAYLIVYDGVQCWGWLLPRPALRLSCKPSLFIDMFYCGQSPGGGRGQGALAFKHGYFNSFPQINQLIIENCQI